MQGHIGAPIPRPRTMFGRSHEEDMRSEVRRGPWSLEEDKTLSHYISRHGEGRWNMLAKCSGLKRTGKSCRLRWLNYLKPDIKRGNLTPQEQLLILELHCTLGNRWLKIAQHLLGRTDNEIKNYWRTRVQRQARHLKVESSSKRFLEAIRRFLAHNNNQSQSQSASPLSVSAQPRTDQQQPIFKESVTSLGCQFVDGDTPLILSESLCGFGVDGLATLNQNSIATSAPEYQVVESDWVIDNMGDFMWGIDDEMWELGIYNMDYN